MPVSFTTTPTRQWNWAGWCIKKTGKTWLPGLQTQKN